MPSKNIILQVPSSLRFKMLDGNHWLALQFVFKRHIIQGQALMYVDLRERTYVMMNDEKVVIRRTGRCEFFLNFFRLSIPISMKLLDLTISRFRTILASW